MLHTVDSYFKTPLKVEAVRAWRNSHVSGLVENKTDIFSNCWHNDNYPYWGVKIFWIVSDEVTRRSGAFRFHNIKSSKSIAKKTNFFHRTKIMKSVENSLLSNSNVNYFEGKVGDMCICNTPACVYADSNPEKGSHCDIIQFEIVPSRYEADFYDKLLRNLPNDRAELTKVFRQA